MNLIKVTLQMKVKEKEIKERKAQLSALLIMRYLEYGMYYFICP